MTSVSALCEVFAFFSPEESPAILRGTSRKRSHGGRAPSPLPASQSFYRHPSPSFKRAEDSSRHRVSRVQGCLLSPKLCSIAGEGGQALEAILEVRGVTHRGLSAHFPTPVAVTPGIPQGLSATRTPSDSFPPILPSASSLPLRRGWRSGWVRSQAPDLGSPKDAPLPCSQQQTLMSGK